MNSSAAVAFKSERFDYQSDLPPGYNAGNRFYGKDVAQFIASKLSALGFPAESMDEDWGWLVFSVRGAATDFSIAVYNLAGHGEGGKPGIGAWGLWMQSYERRKWLGFLSRRVEVPVPTSLLEAVKRVIRESGSEPEPWDDSPAGGGK